MLASQKFATSLERKPIDQSDQIYAFATNTKLSNQSLVGNFWTSFCYIFARGVRKLFNTVEKKQQEKEKNSESRSKIVSLIDKKSMKKERELR